jgi:hypothetical protein
MPLKVIRVSVVQYWCLVPVFIALALSGCQKKPPVALVHGKVLLNNKPLEHGGVITSVDGGRGAQAAIKNGEFELSTFGVKDGALIGLHKVAVVSYEKTNATGPEVPNGKLLVPQRYIVPETSGLKFEVKAGEVNTPTLELKTP